MPDGGRFQTAGWAAQGRAAAVVFLVVLGGCGFEIWARPMPVLAGFRPADALLLGLLLRVPAAARPAGWLAAALAFWLAGLATGSGIGAAALMSLASLVGIGLGYAVLARLPEDELRLRLPASMLWILAAAALGGGGAAIVGQAGPAASDGGVLRAALLRWGDGAVNYAMLLPALLSAPSLTDLKARLLSRPGIRKTDLLPAGAAALAYALALGVEEPGAIALPVLALMWCGLAFPVFLTSLLALGFNLLVPDLFSRGVVGGASAGTDDAMLLSIRLGAVAVAAGPILLSILTHHRNQLMARLHLEAIRDPLTGLLNRAAFREDAALLLRTLKVPEGWPAAAAILMIDLDRFKAINEAHGRAAGDEVLREVARRLSGSVRQGDLIGRLAGEDFAVILRDCAPEPAVEVAERILRAIAAEPIRVSAEQAIEVTASIGLTPVTAGRPLPLEHLLNRAARALYLAKEKGRNQVVATGMPEGRAGHAAAGMQPEAPVLG